MAAITASELRQNVHRLLDQVLRAGTPLEIERSGRRLQTVPVESPGKLARLKAHPDAIIGDPAELVHLDWSGERRP